MLIMVLQIKFLFFFIAVGKIDQCASEALAKVQEKLPIVNQTPSEVC